MKKNGLIFAGGLFIEGMVSTIMWFFQIEHYSLTAYIFLALMYIATVLTLFVATHNETVIIKEVIKVKDKKEKDKDSKPQNRGLV